MERPASFSRGIEAVVVGGEIAYLWDRLTGAHNGLWMRGGSLSFS